MNYCVVKTAVVCGLFALRLAGDSAAMQQISSDSGLRASISGDGSYQLTATGYGWTFSGTIGHAPQNIAISNGTDGIGSWIEIAFDYDPSRSGAIRLYNGSPVALFSTTYGAAAPNADAFPHWTAYPQGLYTFGYNNGWDSTFAKPNGHSPWLFFDARSNAFVISPASNFMTAVNQITGDGALEEAIDQRIDSLPAGFTHRSILAFGSGVNSAFESWGHALTGLAGKQRPANDSVTVLNKLSYWTDAGAAYYYQPQDPTQVVPALQKMPPVFTQGGVPFASMELDSWYYPKGSPPWWGSNGSGMAQFQADSTLFPQGLGAFQKNLGVPLITHARWIDAKSPIRSKYKMSGNVSIDPQYWTDYATYLAANGVEVLEQDWLHANAQTDFNLTDPDAFLDSMASAMSAAGVKLIYCMPLWGDLMQSSKYGNVFAIRISADFLGREKWDTFLFNSRVAGAVGLWPFTDAFNSRNVRDVLLATLSAGPVGSGDGFGSVNAANLQQAVRTDGVIVKPDVPIVPVDATWVNVVRDRSAPMVASTYSDQAGVRTAYVLAYERTEGATGAISFTPESVGVAGAAYVYDYFKAKGSVVSMGSQFTDTVDYSGSYYIVEPIGKSGMAFLGDAGKFVSNGKKRIESLSDDGKVHATVRFAVGESSVVLHLYSPERPYATASLGRVSRVIREGTGLYRVSVVPDATGRASVTFGVRD
jgi:hypothetical protein